MIVNSENIEFGYELISALPHEYSLFEQGKLTKTISGFDTKCLYYFSPEHVENKDKRSFYNTPKAKNIPNIDIHKPYLVKKDWKVPPLKNHYQNERFKSKKEYVIICNRVNKEWNTKAINFFDIDTLRELFNILTPKYKVIYINIDGKKEYYDNAEPISIKDYDLINNEFKGKVINIHDLHKKNQDLSFNKLQLMLFANCSKFITMNGGHGILASYFGGENIIMSKFGVPQAKELKPEVNSFYRWYNEFGDSRVLHVPNEKKLISKVKSLWIKKQPICNILVRTTNRPELFNKCIKSIENQTYENINIFVSYENQTDYNYIISSKTYSFKVEKNNNIPEKTGSDYGIKFPSNLYLNELHKKVKSGFIIYLDDDDNFTDENAVKEIAKNFKTSNNLVFWRVEINNRLIPNDENFNNKKIVSRDISGIGFAFDSKYLKDATWEAYKLGDFRVAINLSKKIKNQVWINKVFTAPIIGKNGSGMKKDISKDFYSNKIIGEKYEFKNQLGKIEIRTFDKFTKILLKTKQIFEI